MRSKAITFLLVLAFVAAEAQNNIPASIARNLTNVAIVVDSVEVAQKSLNEINPNSIQNIDVVRNAKYPGGVLYVTLKDHSLLARLSKVKPVSLAQLVDSEIIAEYKKRPKIYIFDDHLVTDTAAIRVEPNQYHHVRVIPASEMPYFKTTFPDAVLIIVTTTPPPPADGQVRIRGAR